MYAIESLLPMIRRFATPEVFVVLGTLVGGFTAWKVTSWAVRSMLGVFKLFPAALTAILLMFLGGATSTGVGIARWVEWAHSGHEETAGLTAYDVRMIGAMTGTHDADLLTALTHYAAGTAAMHRDDPKIGANEIPSEPPRLDVSFGAMFGGIASCISAITWLCRRDNGMHG